MFKNDKEYDTALELLDLLMDAEDKDEEKEHYL
jgi:hypothetical protein